MHLHSLLTVGVSPPREVVMFSTNQALLKKNCFIVVLISNADFDSIFGGFSSPTTIHTPTMMMYPSMGPASVDCHVAAAEFTSAAPAQAAAASAAVPTPATALDLDCGADAMPSPYLPTWLLSPNALSASFMLPLGELVVPSPAPNDACMSANPVNLRAVSSAGISKSGYGSSYAQPYDVPSTNGAPGGGGYEPGLPDTMSTPTHMHNADTSCDQSVASSPECAGQPDKKDSSSWPGNSPPSKKPVRRATGSNRQLRSAHTRRTMSPDSPRLHWQLPIRPVLRTLTGGWRRKRASEMSPTELARVREANKLVARRQRERQREERDALRMRMRTLNDEHAALMAERAKYRQRVYELIRQLRQCHTAALCQPHGQ